MNLAIAAAAMAAFFSYDAWAGCNPKHKNLSGNGEGRAAAYSPQGAAIWARGNAEQNLRDNLKTDGSTHPDLECDFGCQRNGLPTVGPLTIDPDPVEIPGDRNSDPEAWMRACLEGDFYFEDECENWRDNGGGAFYFHITYITGSALVSQSCKKLEAEPADAFQADPSGSPSPASGPITL